MFDAKDFVEKQVHQPESKKLLGIISPLYNSAEDAENTMYEDIEKGMYSILPDYIYGYRRLCYVNMVDDTDSIIVFVNSNRDMVVICPVVVDGKTYYERIFHKAHHNAVPLREEENFDITDESTFLHGDGEIIYKGTPYYIAVNGKVHFRHDVKRVDDIIDMLYKTETGIEYDNILRNNYDFLRFVHDNDSKFLDMHVATILRLSVYHNCKVEEVDTLLHNDCMYQVNFNNLHPDAHLQLTTKDGAKALSIFYDYYGEGSVRLCRKHYALIDERGAL